MTSEELIEKEANERYPDIPVVLGRGNTCLSCGEVRRDAFETGAKWQKSSVWHKPSEKLPEYEEKIVFLWEHGMAVNVDVGRLRLIYGDKYICGWSRWPIEDVALWAYLNDLLPVDIMVGKLTKS